MESRITELRKALGLTKVGFAKALNVSPNYVYMLESGKTAVTDKIVFTVVTIYNVNESWLRTGEGEMFLPKSKEEEIAEIAAQMFKADENDFRYRLQKLVTELSEDELELLKELAIKLGEAAKKESPLE